jgi:hypothetical protein
VRRGSCVSVLVRDRFQDIIAAPRGSASWDHGVRRAHPVLNDQPQRISNDCSEVVERLLADACEPQGSQDRVHVRRLKDLQKGQALKPNWVQVMAARRRKTLVVCEGCHVAIHYG